MLTNGAIGAIGHEATGGDQPPAAGATVEECAPEDRTTDLAAVVRAQVDTWPPLTDGQRERLSVLLRPGREP